MVGKGLLLSVLKREVPLCHTFAGNAMDLIFLVPSIKINCYLSSEIFKFTLTVHVIYEVFELCLECDPALGQKIDKGQLPPAIRSQWAPGRPESGSTRLAMTVLVFLISYK